MPAQVLVYFATTPVAYAAPMALLLSLSSAPSTQELWRSTSRRHQQYVLHLHLSCKTSRRIINIRYTCTCGGTHRAGISSVRCTCACCEAHRASTSSVLRRASRGTEALAFAPAAYAAPLRLQQIASVLSLLCPPSPHSPVVKYIAPALAVYAVLVPVVVYIAPAQAVSWTAPAQVLITWRQRL